MNSNLLAIFCSEMIDRENTASELFQVTNGNYSAPQEYSQVLSLAFQVIKSVSDNPNLLYFAKLAYDYDLGNNLSFIDFQTQDNALESMSTLIAVKVLRAWGFLNSDEYAFEETDSLGSLQNQAQKIDYAISKVQNSLVSPYMFLGEFPSDSLEINRHSLVLEYFLSGKQSIRMLPSLIFWATQCYINQKINQESETELQNLIGASYDIILKTQSFLLAKACVDQVFA